MARKPLAEPTEPALEAAIAAKPDDLASFAVYADWLQAQDHPRGRLAAVQAALAKLAAGKPYDEYVRYPPLFRHVWHHPTKAAGAKKLYTEQADLLAEHGLDPRTRDLAGISDGRYGCDAEWLCGFVRAARFRLGGTNIERLASVTAFVGHPSSRFLHTLVLGELFDDGYGAKALAAIAKVTPATLRYLHIGDFSIGEPEISWVKVGALSPFYDATPDLDRLIVQGGEIDCGPRISFSKLRHLEIRTGGLSKEAARAIAASKLPALTTLSVWFGQPEYGATATFADIAPILDGTQVPSVRHLGLANAGFGNDLAAAIGGAKILKQLRSLDLSLSSLDDEGARALADTRKSMRHLDTLNLARCHLTDTGLGLVQGLAKTVIVDDQREPYDWDDEDGRYAAVGE